MKDELTLAIEVAKKAGDIILDYYEKGVTVSNKLNDTPVTSADLAADAFIGNQLRKNFSYKILSEESADDKERLGSEYLWIVDPLDGTKDFINRNGEFTVVIGLVHKGIPVLGVVFQPTTQKLYYALKGGGAFLDSDNILRQITVSDTDNLADAKFAVSTLTDKCAEEMDQLGFVKRERVGSLALKGCLLAQGSYDAYFAIRTKISEWDTCASGIILSEAGGKITDAKGNELLYNQVDVSRPMGVMMDNGIIHEQLVEKLKPLVKKEYGG